MKKTIILSLLSAVLFTGCYDLDIEPKNLITDEDIFTNESGLEVYFARLYSYMPFEDFRYMGEWGFEFNSWLGSFGIEGTGEALNRDGIAQTLKDERTKYWGMAFTQIREANYVIEKLPEYATNFSEQTINYYLGQAYFIRGFTFYTMAKRYGGVPLTLKVIDFDPDGGSMEIPRASEEETWDQILEDFDMAIELLPEEGFSGGYTQQTGWVGKYAALAWKSEAMLYAGSVAKYNETVDGRLTGLGRKTGVRVIGFDQGTAKAAAARYFTEAYLAGREVMNSGRYSLYRTGWGSETNPSAQVRYQNMVDMFSDISKNPENIFVKEYVYPTYTHGIDAYSGPMEFRNPLACGTCPTLDFLELFDGFPRYPDNTIKVTTGNTNTEGTYEMYDSPMDFFANAEPRARAYILFPSDMFRNTEISVRTGVYFGSEPVQPLFSNYSYADAETTKYPQSSAAQSGDLILAATTETNPTVNVNGVDMLACGINGPFTNQGESALTGMLLRKWLNPDPAARVGQGLSDQPFILMRYADVLLNVAEAAIELTLEGVPSPDGGNLTQIATDAIIDIRDRAGAEIPAGFAITASEAGRNLVRKERRKELALEHKSKWDIRRWRVQHYENRDGLWGEIRDKSRYSNGNNYRFRGLFPFLSASSGKYFFDAHFQTTDLKTFNFAPVNYYFEIPSGEVTKSSVIDQQPNR